MWNKIAAYFRMNPARVSAYISTLVLYINKHFPALPIDIAIPSALIIIGFGEHAQRAENRKTIQALYTESAADVPDEDIMKKLCYNKSRKKRR
jgi:hypothetical protein